MNKKILWAIPAVLLVVCLSVVLWENAGRSEKEQVSEVQKQEQTSEPAVKTAEAINGLLVDAATAGRRPVAVMVENHPDSRPQSGLLDADVVYETVAEGGITRFLAVYQTKQAASIGPVRSARDYYAEIADELGALYAHVGGSNEVIDQLKRGVYKNLSDANEYYNENFFRRVKNRYAPHNVYTSIKNLDDLAAYRKYSGKADYVPWQFKDDSVLGSPEAVKISMDFSEPGYSASYQYDSQKNIYMRSMAGQPHKDAETKKQLEAKTVIVQLVPVAQVPNDPLLHVNINLEGSGRAVVFMDGIAVEAKWQKQPGGRTRYTDQQGQEIKFNRGLIWVELVPKDKEPFLSWSVQ